MTQLRETRVPAVASDLRTLDESRELSPKMALLRHRGRANAGLNAGEVRTYRRGYPKAEFDPKPKLRRMRNPRSDDAAEAGSFR